MHDVCGAEVGQRGDPDLTLHKDNQSSDRNQCHLKDKDISPLPVAKQLIRSRPVDTHLLNGSIDPAKCPLIKKEEAVTLYHNFGPSFPSKGLFS